MFKLVLSLLLVGSLTGCVAAPIILVGAGAVGGYAISRDTFEGNTNKSQDELWDSANKVLSIMGSIDHSDRKRDELDGHVNGATVWITVIPVNASTTKLRIKARKNLLPAIGIAQDVYAKIINLTE